MHFGSLHTWSLKISFLAQINKNLQLLNLWNNIFLTIFSKYEKWTLIKFQTLSCIHYEVNIILQTYLSDYGFRFKRSVLFKVPLNGSTEHIRPTDPNLDKQSLGAPRVMTRGSKSINSWFKIWIIISSFLYIKHVFIIWNLHTFFSKDFFFNADGNTYKILFCVKGNVDF